MPLLTPDIINKLIRTFDPVEGRSICVPIHGRKRGNPVLWGKSYISEMIEIVGDTGATQLIENHADQVFEVNFESDNILFDVDTPDLLSNLDKRLKNQ